MREFYKNSKRNTLRYIVFKNKTKQLPYLRLVPKNEMRFLRLKGVNNTVYYSLTILPNNEYHRYQSRYKDKNGKRKRWQEFSCIDINCNIIMRNLKQISCNKKVKSVSLLGRRSRRYKRRDTLRNKSIKKQNR